MNRIVVIGENPLRGTVQINGAKNAFLPVFVATLLAPGKYRISRVPDLRDTHTMMELLTIIGAEMVFENGEMTIDTSNCNHPEAPYDLVKTMRASFYVLGPLLSRFGYAKVSMPGGCAWGPRPINFHVSAMESLGAEATLESGYIIARAKRLKGNTITFDIPSVGATGNTLMAAVKAEGKTTIKNAAKEPEIVCLCDFLVCMGARISGIGTETITVDGVEELHPTDFEIIPDRIESATMLIAGAMIGDEVTVSSVNLEHISVILDKLTRVGSDLTVSKDSVTIKRGSVLHAIDIQTAVYPGFPTDVQAQWMALMTQADGTSIITDNIYHDRFAHVAELNRFGAKILLKENSAIIAGNRKLRGAPVMSTDIRGSASLILAALVAKGRTDISRVYHIERGYERIEEKLSALGAEIWREVE